SGYVADIGYTYGFYRELGPELISLVALANGLSSFRSGEPLNYCELGCGQGLSMNILASANPHIQFHATDFNPSQIAGARALAMESGVSNLKFYDTSFSDFADKPELPEEFDIISLHGIYSWINAELRASIVEFINRKLKVGGLVYISYNALPGWSAVAPMRHLMYLHGNAQGGPTDGRLQPALDFMEAMQKSGAGYFRAVPGLGDRLEAVKAQNRNYLAHEYFNDAWDLFYHSDVVRDLDKAKLTFVGSAALLEQMDAINLTPDQQNVIGDIADPALRETAKDYMTNKQFRRDVFAKGPLRISARATQKAWLERRFALSVPRQDVEMKVSGALGDATLQTEVYSPLLEALDGSPKTVRELTAEPAVAALGWGRLQQALFVLVGMGHVQPCLPAQDQSARIKSTTSFNLAAMQRAQDNADLQYLASPVTGNGIAVDRFQQLFLLALANKEKDPAEFIWRLLEGQGQRLVKEGKTLQSAEENLSELRERYLVFEKRLPTLKSLGIA
ncbi:MAG: methyltransferase regulatory domain-containing protein, partial [Devosia sp.]|nr:methyltransferase regulatory domain-containing protein [Devosia sp.]